MNWQHKYQQNQLWIHRYMAFMQSQSLNQTNALKIISEIGRLNSYNIFIENMLIQDYLQAVEIITIHQDSKL